MEGMTMQARVRKWGNSLGVRIPLPIRTQFELEENDYVDIQARNNEIVIRKLKKIPTYSLSELCKGITPENLHTEIEDDAPVGKEVW